LAILRRDDIKKMGEKEIGEKIDELMSGLTKARTKISSKMAPDNPGHVREMRRTIAKLKTERRQRQKR